MLERIARKECEGIITKTPALNLSIGSVFYIIPKYILRLHEWRKIERVVGQKRMEQDSYKWSFKEC